MFNHSAILFIFAISGHLCECDPHDDLKADLHDLRSLVADLKINQEILRQSANDHTVVHWLQTTVAELRAEMAELAGQLDLSRGQAGDVTKRLDNEIGHFNTEIHSMRVDIKDLTIDLSKMHALYEEQDSLLPTKGRVGHHVKILTEELKHLGQAVRHIASKQKALEITIHHNKKHHIAKRPSTNNP